MFCPNCGKNNKSGLKHCELCGAALTKAKAQKNMQKGVDAYDKKEGREDRNLVPTIVIIVLCVLLVVALIVVMPYVLDMMEDSGSSSRSRSSNKSSHSSSQDDGSSGMPNGDNGLSSDNPYAACLKDYKDYVLSDSSSAYLTRSQLSGLSDAELTIALQEIYARHGKSFTDANLQDYFDQRSWYNSGNYNTSFNAYESANMILLEVFTAQRTSGSYSQPGNTYLNHFTNTDSYAIQGSNSRYLTAADLKNLNEDQLIIARNEIFARNGYVFTDTRLMTYFCTKSWYTPTTGAVSESSFNDYERNNIKMIQLYERRLDGVTFSYDNPYSAYFSYGTSEVFPYSDERLLKNDTMYDTNLTNDKVTLGRNEIFARHGYTFTDENLLEYFLQKDWYYPTTPVGDSSVLKLSDVERKNVEHFQALEAAYDRVPSDVSSLNKSMTYSVTLDLVTLTLPAYWKDYTSKDSTGSSVSFKETISSSVYGDGLGEICEFSIVPIANYTGPDDIFRKLGTITDNSGNQWYIVIYTPTDVRHCSLAFALAAQLDSDISRIQITPNTGYIITPY